MSSAEFWHITGEARISHVDVRDIAAVAVKSLTETSHEGKAYSLTGPEALTYDEEVLVMSLTQDPPRLILYFHQADAV